MDLYRLFYKIVALLFLQSLGKLNHNLNFGDESSLTNSKYQSLNKKSERSYEFNHILLEIIKCSQKYFTTRLITMRSQPNCFEVVVVVVVVVVFVVVLFVVVFVVVVVLNVDVVV